ncbi:MAG: hypothetical protein L0Y54_23140, partial [Sporichthyaceae bacterium]|nr:hypothetical protein [Sporichthyaceae bacterium]
MGPGWLAVRRPGRTRWVRTDELVVARLEATSATVWLRLVDRQRRSLRVPVDELRASPTVYEQFAADLGTALANGLVPDTDAVSELRLPTAQPEQTLVPPRRVATPRPTRSPLPSTVPDAVGARSWTQESARTPVAPS